MHDLSLDTGRTCFREPIPEIEEAAQKLLAAGLAHNAGNRATAERLLKETDTPLLWEWLDRVWGKKSPFTGYRKVEGAPPVLEKGQRAHPRYAKTNQQRDIHLRDGYYCRGCGIPVVRAEIRRKFAQSYPEAVSWRKSNKLQHAAFQVMWAQYDHVLPWARGGTTDLSNLVLTCAACNYGRGDKTLAQVGMLDPRDRTPRSGPWDGLEFVRFEKR